MEDARAHRIELIHFAALALGLFLQFNLVPIAWHIPVPRITQLLMLLALGWLAYAAAFSKIRPKALPYFLVSLTIVALHLAFSGTSLRFGNDNSDLSISVGFVLYLWGGVAAYIMLSQRGTLTWFCWGVVIGAVLSVIPFILQANGMTALTESLGMAPVGQVIQNASQTGFDKRLAGMWGHANEVGHVVAAAAPAAGYLLVARGQKTPIVLLVVVAAVCFNFTGNRGGPLALTLTLIAAFFLRPGTVAQKRKWALIALVVLGGVYYLLYVLPPPTLLYMRFLGDSNLNNNAAGRLDTTMAGLGLVLQHPFGMAPLDWHDRLKSLTGFSTPHNGFIALAYGLGLPFTLLFAGALASVAWLGFTNPLRRPIDAFLALAALELGISFMFEELAYCDVFMFMIGLIMARVYSQAIDARPVKDERRMRVRTSRGRTAR